MLIKTNIQHFESKILVQTTLYNSWSSSLSEVSFDMWSVQKRQSLK